MAEDLGHLQRRLAVLAKEMQEFFAGDEIGLDRFECFRRYFVWLACDCPRNADKLT